MSTNGNWYDDLTPDIASAGLERLLNEYDTRRNDLSDEYERLYDASIEPVHMRTMSAIKYDEVRNAWIPVPLLQLLVSKIATMMYGRAVDRTTGDTKLDGLLEPIWSRQKRLMPQVCKSASLMGDGAIRMAPSWQTGVTLTWWDARHVVPIYDPITLEIVGIIYDYLSDSVESQISRAIGGSGKVEAIMEIVTRHVRDQETGAILQPGIRARFKGGKRVPWNSVLYGGEDGPYLDGLNPMGDFLDCVFWRNDDAVTGIRGASDAESLRRLLIGINDLLVQGRMIMQYNAYPIIKTTADFEGNPSVHAGKMFQLGTDDKGNPATMEYLEWSQNMGGYMTFLDRLIGLVHETAQVPSVAVGDLEHIGALSSGRAYEVAMSPLLDLVNMREMIYEVQELDLIYLCVAGMALVGKAPDLCSPFEGIDNMPDFQKIKDRLAEASVEFAPINVARDVQVDAMVHATRISAGYESEEQAIRETHPDWADDRIAEELKKAGADAASTIDAATAARGQALQERLRQERDGNA